MIGTERERERERETDRQTDRQRETEREGQGNPCCQSVLIVIKVNE